MRTRNQIFGMMEQDSIQSEYEIETTAFVVSLLISCFYKVDTDTLWFKCISEQHKPRLVRVAANQNQGKRGGLKHPKMNSALGHILYIYGFRQKKSTSFIRKMMKYNLSRRLKTAG